MGGFIGATEDGVTTTLGRGGSDFTASIVGAGIGAEEIQIWTDVDGMLTADPTILPGGHRVKTISFAEAAELAYFGAKVLHPATVVPAIEKNIPVLILNSRRPEVPGTRIVADAVPCGNVVKSIACKRKITLVNIHSTRMLMAHGFLRRIFEVFDRYETPVDMVATSRSQRLADHRQHRAAWTRSWRELRQFAEVVDRKRPGHRLPGGRKYPLHAGRGARAFSTPCDGINIRMISQGASLLNLSFVVAEADLRRAVDGAARRNFSPSSIPSGFRAQSRPCMPEPRRLAIVGYGKMGRLIEQLAPGIRLRRGAEARRIQQRQFRRPDARRISAASTWPSIFPSPPPCRDNVEGIAALGVNLVIGTTGWLDQLDAVKPGRGAARHRAGLESQLFHRRERLLPPGGGGRAAAGQRSRNTAPGPGRFITPPRRTRLRAHC